jgi:2-amino-4-hydroxy-6-hydroxymethyldihydropteridine diphosphokinase
MSTRAFLGIGSNLGDRLETLQHAVGLLHATPGIDVVASSRVYETDPVGGVEQPDFLNAVLEISTDLSAEELLARCLAVEAELGRTREIHWGPRTIDVDVLGYDEATITEAGLVVPHPRMHERAFVMMPLLELEPDPMLPDGLRAADAEPNGEVRLFGPPLEIPR